MRTLKTTEEYRVDSEVEAKEAMEKFREDAKSKGYSIGKCGYTYKAKRTLINAAEKDKQKLIVCTFDCGQDFTFHKLKLFKSSITVIYCLSISCKAFSKYSSSLVPL